MSDLYAISDIAYNHLVRLATDTGFVKSGAVHKIGISRFTERLSYRRMIDTRPRSIKGADRELLRIGRVPVWKRHYQRWARTLNLSEEAIERYCRIAIEHRIVIGRGYKGGPNWKSATSIVGAVLEAIGLGWLTPTSLPEELSRLASAKRKEKSA